MTREEEMRLGYKAAMELVKEAAFILNKIPMCSSDVGKAAFELRNVLDRISRMSRIWEQQT